MAKNRHSTNGCPNISAFDRTVKERFFPSASSIRITNIRGVIQDHEEYKEALKSSIINSSAVENLTEAEKNLYNITEDLNNLDVIKVIDTIDSKLVKKEELTNFELAFIQGYKNYLESFIIEAQNDSIKKDRIKQAGVQTSSAADMYNLFKSKIPMQYREATVMQICSIVVNLLDKAETYPQFKDFTRREIIEYFHTKPEITTLRGFEGMMVVAKLLLKQSYEACKKASDDNRAIMHQKEVKGEKYNPANYYVLTPENEELFQTLLNDPDAWAACIYQAKSLLLDTEKIKIGSKVKYVEDMEEEDASDGNPDAEVRSAEEEAREHFLIKADTMSSFNSMAKEVRSIFYRLTKDRNGVLGFPDIEDAMLIHQHLLAAREQMVCEDSSEFLQLLGVLGESNSWAGKLLDILKKDPWKRTAVFNAHRKNLQHYSYQRKTYVRNDALGSTVPVRYRNTNKRNVKVLMGAYTAGVLDIDEDNNKVCIFTKDGSINVSNFRNLKSTLASIENEEGTYDISKWGRASTESKITKEQYKEKKRDFINTINKALNLHLAEEDVNSLMSNEKDFKSFTEALQGVIEFSNIKDKDTLKTILNNSTAKKFFRRLLLAAKKTITIQERESPVEEVFRYNKSTYMAHVVPTSVGDTLERLRKAAKNKATLKSFLEETYLKCPSLATKNNDGSYTIYNYWFKILYEATQEGNEDLNNSTSPANMLIQALTRGLGTDDIDFTKFSEKDNYLYTLDEYFQNYLDTEGKFGATPLFITGDSNSTRFFTTPILSNEEIIEGMVTNIRQEIERMRMFNALIEKFDKEGTKISDGHAGKTVAEWRMMDINKRPSIIKNADCFTFFPFLNKYAKDLVSLYNTDREAFDTKVRSLLNEHLDETYRTFVQDLEDKKIATKRLDGQYELNPYTLSIKEKDGNTFLDTSFNANPSNPDPLKNFYLNTKFHLIQQLQFLTIDPGFYKNIEDLQKRFKETIAAGDLLDLEALDPSDPTKKVDNNNGKQNVIYLDEQTTDLDASDEEGGSAEDRNFMAALRQSGFFNEDIVGDPSTGKKGTYNKNSLTDGQGWRSFTSYRKLMIMRGEPFWTKAHEEVYKIIMKNRKAGKTRLDKGDYQRILDLGVVFQPLKPFYYGFESVGDVLIPVQHKYSEFPIIPELLPAGCKLGELGRAMENNNIDLACCTTCVKVGGFGSTDVKGCKTAEDFKNAFNRGYTHQLSLKGWRQQSNVPEHYDAFRARGTQFTKHGYGSIAETQENKHYDFVKRLFPSGKIRLTKTTSIDVSDGLNAQNLIQLFGALGSAPFIHSSIKLNKDINNPKKVSEILSELRANDSRGAKDNIGAYGIDEKGEILLSPAEGMMAKDNMASLFSKLRKEVIKQPIKGGSAVQVSGFGFDDILKVHTKPVTTPEGERLNITYADCATTFAFSYSYEDGTTVDLSSKYLDYVDPDTCMLLDEKGESVDPEEPVPGEKGKEFYGWNTKLGKQFPGILDMIAYRIPTEKDYSILNLRAKRFFPKTMGGIMIVPSQYTSIAGFDFDIDKLYFIRREYVYKKKPDISNYEVWTDYYTKDDQGKEIYPYLVKAAENGKKMKYDSGHRFFGTELYLYWAAALALMEQENKSTEFIPSTAEDAFEGFIARHLEDYAELLSIPKEDETILGLNQAACNNLFFNFMQARLEDYDTFEERYVPGGFKMLEDAKPIMMAIRYAPAKDLAALATAKDPDKALMDLAEKYKDFSPVYDPTELSTIAHYQTYNALYDNCISVAAVQNINQRLTALLNKLELKKAVLFGSLLDSSDPAAGKDIKKRKVNGVDTEILTTNFLDASVDAIKNAVLEFFGIDDQNLNIGCLMSKIGCTPKDMGLLLNQPVVRIAMNIMKESGGYKGVSNALYEALQELSQNKYEDMINEFYPTLYEKGVRNNYVSTKELIRYIGLNASLNYNNDLGTFLRGQFAVVHLMNELQADAQELAEQVAITQSTSVKSVKSSFGAIQSVIQKVKTFVERFGDEGSAFNVELPSGLKKIIDPSIRITEDNMDEILGELVDSPYCMEQVAFSAIMGYADSLGNYFPYMSEGFTALSDGLASLTSRDYLSAEMFDAHNTYAMMYFLERMTDLFNEDTTVKIVTSEGNTLDTGIPNRIFYTAIFPLLFRELLKDNEKAFEEKKAPIRYKSIPILGSIAAIVENYDKKKSSMVLKFEGIGGLRSRQKDNEIGSWEAMFSSEDPVLRDLAKHLFLYSYYNRGFDFGPTTFMSLVPLVVKMLIDDGKYAEFYNRVFNVGVGDMKLLQERGGLSGDISLKDYYKAFILNTMNTFYQFTKKLYYKDNFKNSPYDACKRNMTTITRDVVTGEMVTEAYLKDLREKLKKEGYSEEDIKTYMATNIVESSVFTVSLDSEEDRFLRQELANIQWDENFEIVSASFVPCVVIDGKTFICDSDIASKTNSKFNEIKSGSITYYQMDVPIGVDFSTPTLYGTRVATWNKFKDLGQILESTRSAYSSEASPNPKTSSSTEGTQDVADAGNTFGNEKLTGSTLAIWGGAIEALETILHGLDRELYTVDSETYKSIRKPKEETVFIEAAIQIIKNMTDNLIGDAHQPVSQSSLDRLIKYKEQLLTNPISTLINTTRSNVDTFVVETRFDASIARLKAKLSNGLNAMAEEASNSSNAKQLNLCQNK